MGDSLFQITGVSSGIDWGAIIEKSIEAAKKPATKWQSKIDTLEVKKTLYQQLSSEFYKLRNTLTPLKLESTYLAKAAEFSVYSPAGADASSIVKATPKTSAAIAAWDLDIQQIAKTQRHISAKTNDPSAALNIEGSFRIMADERWTTIKIEKGDTIRDINQKLQKSKDQFGNSMPITAQLIDNRLVIDSLNPGLNQKDTKTLEPITMSDSNLMYLPRAGLNYSKTDSNGDPVQSSYPPQLLSVSSGNTTYIEGTDYTYDADKGLITWLTGSGTKRPAVGDDVDLLYVKDTEVTRGSGNRDLLPAMPSGASYHADTRIDIFKSGGGKYTQKEIGQSDNNWDYEIDPVTEEIVWNTSTTTGNTLPASGDKYTIRIGAQSNYSTSQNKFYLEADDMSANSVLAKLGFITVDEGTGNWEYTKGSVTEAQDAKLTINGVPVTRQTNTIEDLIADVTLELKGEGKVSMNITQDAQKAVESMQAFIDQYNAVMQWVNDYLNQKGEASNPLDESENALSELLNNTKGKTIFGPLHGDQLLWSIKNQMRNMIANPITTFSGTLNSKKFLHPAEALSMQGAFYINVGGMSAKINVSKDDSLEDIRNKLQEATNGVGTEKGGGLPSSDKLKSLGLDVAIQDGQLVIKTSKVTSGTTERSPDTLSRTAGQNFDYLTFVPESASPVSGVLTVSQGNKVYVEGKDFRVAKEENSDGVIQSKIVWLDGGSAPKTGETYNVGYKYNASAITYNFIADSGSSSSSGYTRSLSELGLHQDASKILLSRYGITTESTDYGKSGLLEFDSDKFFAALKDDPKTVSTVMTSFMRDVMDSYIGNLVDSTNVVVGSTVVTKGRVATELKAIDTEIGNLNTQITKLEKSLEQKQTAMYKRYTDMEQAIQKMNAQLSSMTQYFNNTSGKK